MPAVTVVDVTVTDTTLPKVPASLMPDYPDYEQTSTEHWLFDKGSSAGLIGTKSGLVLTPTGLAPTFPGAYLTLPGGGLRGLITPWDDDDAAGTDCFVMRYPAATSAQTLILASDTGTTAAGGEFFYLSDLERLACSVRGYSAQATTAAGSMPAATWLFVANRRVPGTRTVYRGVDGASFISATTTGTKTIATPMRKRVIGNAYRNAAGYIENPLDLAEAIFFPDAKDDAALLAIYLRSKERMADRGLVLA
jgi:hypothetical protein